MKRLCVAWIAVLLWGSPASAQPRLTGYVSVFLDHFPNRESSELRTRALVEETFEPGTRVKVTASGFVEGLIADRHGTVTAAVAEPQDLSVEFRTRHADITAGFTRIVWGRLDELQPTDVINPLDLSRFLFDGRGDARLAVPLIRGRVFAGEDVSIEAIYVPFFRRGRFDRLDEATSPFNLAPVVSPVQRDEPAHTLAHAQGGVRLNVTTGRVDWSVSSYRGFKPFGLYTARPRSTLPSVTEIFPRFTMVGGDVESVAGPWGVRGEVAAFVEDAFQAPNAPAMLAGRSVDAGAGVDRKAGLYRISGSVLVHAERYDRQPVPTTNGGRTDVSVILSADRHFAREKYQARVFAVYNPLSRDSFVRGIATATLRDNVALEGSIGWFAGTGADTIGRFADSDFGYVRLKYYF